MSDFASLMGDNKPKKSKKVKRKVRSSLVDRMKAYLLQPAFVLTAVALIICSFIIYISIKSAAIGPALSFLMISLTIFGVAIIHEVITRRQWEEVLSYNYARMTKKLGHLEDQIISLTSENDKLKVNLVNVIDQLQEKASLREQRHYQDVIHDLGVIEEEETDDFFPENTTSKMMRANFDYHQDKIKQDMSSTQNVSSIYSLPELEDIDLIDIENEFVTPPSQAKRSTPRFDTHVVDTVSSAVREDRVDIFLQPIVTLPQRKTVYYEAFARLRTAKDNYLPAEEYLEYAENSSLMPVIDNLLLLRTVQHMRVDRKKTNEDVKAYFINLNVETLTNATFMSDLVDFLSDNQHLASRLVLEMKQADFMEVENEIWPLMMGLAKIGCRFSLDDVTDFDLNAERLKQRSIYFIKTNAALLEERVGSAIGERAFREMKKDLEFYDIELIVQKIEDEEDLLNLLDVNIDFGQGYLFGHPTHHAKLLAA